MTTIKAPDALKLVRGWEALGPWSFPKTPDGLEALVRAFCGIAGTPENAEKLSHLVVMGCSRCPTPIELRKIMSNKIGPPADGLHEASTDLSDLMSGGGKKDA